MIRVWNNPVSHYRISINDIGHTIKHCIKNKKTEEKILTEPEQPHSSSHPNVTHPINEWIASWFYERKKKRDSCIARMQHEHSFSSAYSSYPLQFFNLPHSLSSMLTLPIPNFRFLVTFHQLIHFNFSFFFSKRNQNSSKRKTIRSRIKVIQFVKASLS